MAAFNLFANIDEFSSNDFNNYSYPDLESSVQDVDTPPQVSPKKVGRAARSKKTRAKANPKPRMVMDCSDDETPDVEVTIKPGVGQKTAFKKLSKLKQSLETTAVVQTIKTRTRSAINETLREALQQNRVKRARRSDTTQTPCVNLTSAAVQPNISFESFEEDDLNVFIKIKWEGTSTIERIPFSKYKTFNELIASLSRRDNIDAAKFLLMLGNRMIKPDDNPHSIGYTLGKFISVRIVDNPNSYIAESTSSSSQCDTIEVKIQSPKWKKPFICNIKLTDQFKVLTGMCSEKLCSEKLQCPPNTLRFRFDGDIIDISDTPADHDFEGGEILDLIMAD